jgi:hypothetical protein
VSAKYGETQAETHLNRTTSANKLGVDGQVATHDLDMGSAKDYKGDCEHNKTQYLFIV